MNRMALSNLKNQRTRVRSVVIKCWFHRGSFTR
jgi:hypothetical protein